MGLHDKGARPGGFPSVFMTQGYEAKLSRLEPGCNLNGMELEFVFAWCRNFSGSSLQD